MNFLSDFRKNFLLPTPFTELANSGLLAMSCRLLLLRRRSLGGRGGLEPLVDSRARSFSIGGGGVLCPGDSTAEPSGSRGRSLTMICGVLLLFVRPRLVLLALVASGRDPSSATSSRVGAILSKRLLAPLSRRRIFRSASLSFRLRSRLASFLLSFSSSRAHHPARESHRCERTLSITLSISTPAAFMRSKVFFSRCVANGAG